MNKVMLVVLLLVCSLGYEVLAVETPAATPVATPLPTTKVNPKDGAEMVWVPAGEFLMGSSDDDKLARDDEKPQRKVYLDGYWIYKTEVTVAQYRKFCDSADRKMPTDPLWKLQDTQPIVSVDWFKAKDYADWAGAALPTEAQWEKAARGTDGRIYPWGNEWDASKLQCSKVKWGDAGKSASVGSFPDGASPYGAMDMAGNEGEWCADWYGSNYYKTAPAKNPTGPDVGTTRVQRSGIWVYNYPGDFRAACRDGRSGPGLTDYLHIGFRCVIRSPGP